jgi:ammonia channel protein AmtB
MANPQGWQPIAPSLPSISYGLDKTWIIVSAAFVFVMLLGLGFLEIGSIRRKNSRIVWYRILLNLVNTIFWMFILGFAWGFGDVNGSMIGAERFYAGNRWRQSLDSTMNQQGGATFPDGTLFVGYPTQFAHYCWRVAQAVIALNIATAILSERITMKATAIFGTIFNICIMPWIFAWTFGFGFLTDDIGYWDQAGSFIIFGTGAVAGLAGLLFIKPRYNRYGRYPSVIPTVIQSQSTELRPVGTIDQRNLPSVAFDKFRNQPVDLYTQSRTGALGTTAFTAENIVRSRKRQDEDVNEHFGVTDYGLVVFGALLTFIGFIFFNAGASQGMSTFLYWGWAETAAANTLLAFAGAVIVTGLFLAIFGRKRAFRENAATIARAGVAGMVCVAANVLNYHPWEGLVVGMFGALAYVICAFIFARARLDDPAEFFSIFGAAGIAGVICAAFWNTVNGIFWNNPTEGEILIWQLLSLGIMAGWIFIISLITFALLRVLRLLRVGLKTEIVGYDYIDGARHLDYPDKGIHTLEKQKAK